MDCPVTARPTVIVISDSLGDTACEVVLAASGQFDEGAFRVLRLPKVTSVEQVTKKAVRGRLLTRVPPCMPS